jgi:hypothetical protein
MRRALGILLAAIALCATPASSAAAPLDQFCPAQTIVDYLPPAGLPALRELPPSSRLPFAPSRVRIGRDQRPGLPKGMGVTDKPLAFDLGALGTGGVKVDWKVETLLTSIRPSGKPRKAAASRVQRIRRVPSGPGKSLGLRPGTFKPGLYRLDLVFRDGGGERLGRYSEYVKVVAPRSEFTLALSAPAFRPEDPVYAQVRNPGTDPLSYAGGYLLERLDDGVWTRVEERGNGVVFGTTAVPPGQAARCEPLLGIPREAPPGVYRLTMTAFTMRPLESHTLTAEFTVEAPPAP